VCLCLFYWFDLRHSVFSFIFLLAVLIFNLFLMSGFLYVIFVENAELHGIGSFYY
jgi:hypothetical protein